MNLDLNKNWSKLLNPDQSSARTDPRQFEENLRLNSEHFKEFNYIDNNCKKLVKKDRKMKFRQLFTSFQRSSSIENSITQNNTAMEQRSGKKKKYLI